MSILQTRQDFLRRHVAQRRILSVSFWRILLLVGLICGSSNAEAQLTGITTDTGKNLSVDHYLAATSAMGLLTVPTSDAQQLREWSVGLHANYMHNPLVVYAERLRVGNAISHRASAEVVASVGLLSWLELGFAIPFTGYQTGEPGLPTQSIASSGLQDPRVHAKFEIVSAKRAGGFGMAFVPEMTLPFGDDQAFLGAGGITGHPQMVFDLHTDWLLGFRIGTAAGVRIRPDVEIGNLALSHEATYRLGAGLAILKVGQTKLEAIGEFYGTTQLTEFVSDTARSPLIGVVGLKNYTDVDYGHQLITTFGVGVGLNRGYGAPDYQGMVGVMYRRWLSDRDGDGIYDDEDYCPEDPEDKDGFEDANGCPDPDNDKDGIPDVSDRCPSFPEDIDQYKDLDGCPDPDNDRDQILDKDDKCPNVPEDLDGIQDEDGCPEDDSDTDGIPDAQDRCPYEKETINGVEDDDGCPDEGKSSIEVTSKSIRITQKIFFELNSARIDSESYIILNQVALSMKANPQIGKIRIEGHADERGSDDYNLLLTQKRAESVMQYLVDRGVAPERLEAVGYGEMRPLILESNDSAWELNRRVEFTIVESGAPPSQGGREFQMPVTE